MEVSSIKLLPSEQVTRSSSNKTLMGDFGATSYTALSTAISDKPLGLEASEYVQSKSFHCTSDIQTSSLGSHVFSSPEHLLSVPFRHATSLSWDYLLTIFRWNLNCYEIELSSVCCEHIKHTQALKSMNLFLSHLSQLFPFLYM